MSGNTQSSSRSSRTSPSLRLIEQFLGNASSKLTGLLLGQLDAFNRISTTFGHDHADVFCAEYVDRLRNVLPQSTPVLRLSGRRFAVLINMDSMSKIVDVAVDLAERQQPHLRMGDDTFFVDVTIGVAVFPTHADDAASLFRRAELALKEARENELTHEIYRPDATRQQAALWKFESEIERAIQQGDFEVHYQPQMDLRAREISGCEALIRWRSETGGHVSPDSFVPIIERTGGIVPVTWLVFDQVARDCRGWEPIPSGFSTSINVSPQVLEHTEFFQRLDRLKAVLDSCGLGLSLELTEDSLLEGGSQLADKLKRIRRSGVGLSIDDFGKGYSSLTYLRDIPASEVKIDQRFVGTISSDEKDRHIVRAVVELANAFGMTIVAEGVDSEESLRVVKRLGCEHAQGFYIARPMRAELLMDWISKRPVATAGLPA